MVVGSWLSDQVVNHGRTVSLFYRDYDVISILAIYIMCNDVINLGITWQFPPHVTR